MIKISIGCAIFCYDHGSLKVLLSKESNYANAKWGIIEGIIEDDESADGAASRMWHQYGAGNNIFIRQLKTVIDPDKQSSDRNVTIGYYGLINIDKYRSNFGVSPYYKRWWKVTDVPDLLFNHNKILDLSLYQVKNALRESAVSFELLPEEFTLTELYKSL